MLACSNNAPVLAKRLAILLETVQLFRSRSRKEEKSIPGNTLPSNQRSIDNLTRSVDRIVLQIGDSLRLNLPKILTSESNGFSERKGGHVLSIVNGQLEREHTIFYDDEHAVMQRELRVT